MDRKRPSDTFARSHQHITSTIFLSRFSRLQKHTNLTSVMDAKQYALTLPLFVLSGPCVFDNIRGT